MFLKTCTLFLATGAIAVSVPAKRWEYQSKFDLEGHRGGRGELSESTLATFAEGLLDGVTTLEMDNGITKDGAVIVWHDEVIDPLKCRDTKTAFDNDPMFPYVGKNVANLTLAQIKTLDCGSDRLSDFPLQLTAPGITLSTLQEVFDFVKCATDEPVLYNIESKVNPDVTNQTRSPEDFVKAQLAVFQANDLVDRITYQSFDWRTLVLSKAALPQLRTSALCDDTTIYKNPTETTTGNLTVHGEGPSNWLAGIDVDSFNGTTLAERIVQAAVSINADVLSPVGAAYASTASDPELPGFIAFANQTMVDAAHAYGLKVAVWTPDNLNLVKSLLDFGVDGIITDYPHVVRAYLEQRGGYELAPRADLTRVQKCLKKHAQYVSTNATV